MLDIPLMWDTISIMRVKRPKIMSKKSFVIGWLNFAVPCSRVFGLVFPSFSRPISYLSRMIDERSATQHEKESKSFHQQNGIRSRMLHFKFSSVGLVVQYRTTNVFGAMQQRERMECPIMEKNQWIHIDQHSREACCCYWVLFAKGFSLLEQKSALTIKSWLKWIHCNYILANCQKLVKGPETENKHTVYVQ